MFHESWLFGNCQCVLLLWLCVMIIAYVFVLPQAKQLAEFTATRRKVHWTHPPFISFCGELTYGVGGGGVCVCVRMCFMVVVPLKATPLECRHPCVIDTLKSVRFIVHVHH